MADSAVPITAGSGTNIDTATQANGDHRQVVVAGDPVNSTVGKVWPWGSEVYVGLATLFYDTFNGPLDTVDKWTSSGNAPSFSAGSLVMSATASTYNTIRTKDTIRANAGFTIVRNGLTLETSAAVGAGRFWGLGTVQGAPTATSLVADGIGFEIDQATGGLLAVTYVAGTRTTVATLTRPADGAIHPYELQFRVTSAVWLVDGVIVASQSFPNVQVVELPALIVRQNASSFTGTPVFTNIAHLTGQTDPQNKILADPVVGSRQARVKAASTAPVVSDNALVVAQHPSAPTPAGTNFMGYSGLSTPNLAPLGIFASLNPYGGQRVSVEPTPLFMDPFDGTNIDLNRWTAAGTQVPAQATGQITLAPTVGASVSNNATLISVPTFISPGLGFLTFSTVVTLEASQTNTVNVHRFWGKGQVTAYAYATPVTDGIGFEVEGTTGALQCVMYAGGTKYVIHSTTAANISSSVSGIVGSGTALPTGTVASNYGTTLAWQGGQHRYAIFVRSDVCYWFIEGQEKPVAVLSYASPQVQGLPIRLASITNPSGTSLAHTFTVGAFAVNDSTAQNQTLSDSTYQWRRAVLKPATTQLAPATDPALVVTQTSAQALTYGTSVGNSFQARGTFTAVTSTLLVAAPAAGLALYITDVSVSNSGTALSVIQLLPQAGTSIFDIAAAPAGGGGSMSFKTPLRVTTATALYVTPTVASTTMYVTVTGYTAP